VMRPLSDHQPALRRGGNLDAWGRAQPRGLLDLSRTFAIIGTHPMAGSS
jgi:hypothetical protein